MGVGGGCCLQGDLDVGARVIAVPLADEAAADHRSRAVLSVLDPDDVTVGHEVGVGVQELHAHLVGVGDEPDAELLDRRGVVEVEVLRLRDIGVGAAASVESGCVGRAGGGHEASYSESRHCAYRDNATQHVMFQSTRDGGACTKVQIVIKT